MKATKENVLALMIKNGNNAEESKKSIEQHFDWIMECTSDKTAKHVAYMIVVNA